MDEELSPACFPLHFSIDELVVYYSLRGFPLSDIIHLLDNAHWHRIRYSHSITLVYSEKQCFNYYNKRHLIRLRKKLGVSRSIRNESPIGKIITAIEVRMGEIYTICS